MTYSDISSYFHFFTNSMTELSGAMLALLAAIIIMLLVRKKTPRDFSFKVRSALASINGYAKLFHAGKLGPVTDTQQIYLDEILASTMLIADELAAIEIHRLSRPNADFSYKIRSALMNICGFEELIEKDHSPLNAQQKDCLNEIKQAAKTILALLN